MIKHIFVGLLLAFVLGIILSIVTFIVFPLDNWSLLLEKELLDIPYLVVVLMMIGVIGLVGGVVYGVSIKKRQRLIWHGLDALIKGQKLTLQGEIETYKDLIPIQKQVQQLDEKFKHQAQLFQRLATDRATEREKSLQEVVIQERNRLARELHDSVSQQLFAASMMMSAINEGERPKDPTINKQLQMVEKMIHQSQLEMRALLLHLRPVALKGKSLQEGIKELLSELTQKVPMEIESKIEQFNVDKGIEDQLFRILQESVSNTLRHAKANSLHVMLIVRDEMIILRIVDDGIGFNVEEAKTSSYGLQNMNERAEEVGGSLKVVSLKNQGTRLEVKVPLVKKELGNDD
ncbi:NarL family two-component system sensor histidine kinase LiaS [Salirhabdus euzebyi]|uniref:Sensor histidine kinase n=1 Tax=Salirhabdus euzebyi TaxID=394506 RepID=A0A841Q6N0_9BACI|nr:sensor histidine kinase [Salirhabdus euzebyi]MBB6454070.1 NarL family two-component system sensor histidine kinase LiaS [Salirhabdus euzebyi]